MTVDHPKTAGDSVDPPRADDRHTTRRRLAGIGGYFLVIVIQLIVIWPVAMKRAFDGDEGFYAMAAKLVAHGQETYFDFWFQFTPGIAYVYGAWIRLTGESFQSLRALAAILSIALGVVLYAHVARRFSRPLAFAAVILYITSALVFSWYSTYKSYSLATLLLFVAYVLVADADRDEEPGALRWFAAGALVGLSVDVRLYFIAVLPVFAYYAIPRKGRLWTRLDKLPPLLGGLAVGLLPSFYFFVRDPHRFVSDTFLSQTSRSDWSLLDAVVQKLRTAETLFGGAQFLVLVGAAATLAVLVLVLRRRLPLAVAIAGVLALVSLIPTPTYDQYFCTLIPFLVIGAIALWQTVRSTLPQPVDRRLALVVRAAGIAALLLSVAAGAGAYDKLMNTGDFLPDAPHVQAISDAIDAHTGDGEVVVDFSPIDLFKSHAKPVSGLESNFGTFVAENLNLSDREAARYKMLTIDRLEKVVRSKRIRTVVVGPSDAYYFPRPWQQILAESGYRAVVTVGGRTIYQLPQP